MKKIFAAAIFLVMILSVLTGCAAEPGAGPGNTPETEPGHDGNSDARQAMLNIDQFCRVLIDTCPDNIAQFRIQNSFEQTYDSFWFGLVYGNILYSGGATFAVVDIDLYPEYAENGSASLKQDEDAAAIAIEVVRNEQNNYSLLYSPDNKPADTVIDSFVSLPGDAVSGYDGGDGVLQDFFYRSGSWEWRTYELMAGSMLEKGKEDIALFYIKENDWLSDGYPIEVPAGKLQELSLLIEKYNIKDWKESYETEEEVTDGDGFVISMQYDNEYHISTGYMDYPHNYKQAQAELDAFFAEIQEQHAAEVYEQREAGRVKDVTGVYALRFSYGNYVTGAAIYEIKSTDAGLSLSYGDLGVTESYGEGDGGQWIIEDVLMPADAGLAILDIYNKHDAFSWYGYDVKLDGASDFVFLNDLFTDQDGNLVHFSISGAGDMPDGWQPFQEELSAYLDGILGVQ